MKEEEQFLEDSGEVQTSDVRLLCMAVIGPTLGKIMGNFREKSVFYNKKTQNEYMSLPMLRKNTHCRGFSIALFWNNFCCSIFMFGFSKSTTTNNYHNNQYFWPFQIPK